MSLFDDGLAMPKPDPVAVLAKLIKVSAKNGAREFEEDFRNQASMAIPTTLPGAITQVALAFDEIDLMQIEGVPPELQARMRRQFSALDNALATFERLLGYDAASTLHGDCRYDAEGILQ